MTARLSAHALSRAISSRREREMGMGAEQELEVGYVVHAAFR